MKNKLLCITIAVFTVITIYSSTIALANDNTINIDGIIFSQNMKILIKYPSDREARSYTVPDGVTAIDHDAFSSGNRFSEDGSNHFLETVIFPDSLTEIGDRAFSGCTGLEEITIPSSVTTIGKEAFYGCLQLATVNLSEGLTSIGWYAFANCESLRKISLPDTVTKIESNVFENCTSLTSAKLSAGLTDYYSESTFYNCTSLTDVTIPEGIRHISGFLNCTSLKNITLPQSTVEIGYYAFKGCTSLTEITLPNKTERIDSNAFAGCTSLGSITIPVSVTNINENAFSHCLSLMNVFYGATESEWKNIEMQSGNEYLKTANIYFNEAYASQIKVKVYGKPLAFDVPPVIEDGRTLVPLRAIFEALDATVTWDGETRTVRAERYGNFVELTIDSNEMKVDDRVVYLDVPAKIIKDKTFVPVRAIAEAFYNNVEWDADTKTVIIGY